MPTYSSQELDNDNKMHTELNYTVAASLEAEPLSISSISSDQTTTVLGCSHVGNRLPTYRGNPLWKRSIDIIGALGMIVLLFPLLIAVALFVKLSSKGPILFRQPRVGAGGKHFTIFKFRTMKVRPDASQEHRAYVEKLSTSEGPIEKPDHVNRLIFGGKFLRRYSIDELPQLLNVLQGTMSLVGPRPDLLELEDYQNWHLQRFEVLPGMTGLWQVSGKNRLSFRRMIQLDIEYVEKRSLFLDLKILLKTLSVVVRKDNA